MLSSAALSDTISSLPMFMPRLTVLLMFMPCLTALPTQNTRRQAFVNHSCTIFRRTQANLILNFSPLDLTCSNLENSAHWTSLGPF
jgi:hypothetical protein